MEIAPITSAGVVLSQPPISTQPSAGIRAQQFLALHREQVAVQHRRRLLERLGQRDRRHLDRKAAGLPDAALDLLDALLKWRGRVDVAPGVDDGDHRLARVVAAVIAHLRGARAVAEGAQVLDAVPAMASEFFGFLHCGPQCGGSRKPVDPFHRA
jgi:hypothetical protein